MVIYESLMWLLEIPQLLPNIGIRDRLILFQNTFIIEFPDIIDPNADDIINLYIKTFFFLIQNYLLKQIK